MKTSELKKKTQKRYKSEEEILDKIEHHRRRAKEARDAALSAAELARQNRDKAMHYSALADKLHGEKYIAMIDKVNRYRMAEAHHLRQAHRLSGTVERVDRIHLPKLKAALAVIRTPMLFREITDTSVVAA